VERGGIPSGQPAQPDAAAPSHLRWQSEAARTRRCTVATASTTPDQIILNFGITSDGEPGGERQVTLLRRIVLSPLTAKHLSATLHRLIADHDRLQKPRV
jgi:hypothetical protein